MVRAKFLSVFCVIFMLFVVSGCSQQAVHDDDDDSPKKPSTAAKTPAKKPAAVKVPKASTECRSFRKMN